MLNHPTGLLSGDYNSAFRGCWPVKFLHTLQLLKMYFKSYLGRRAASCWALPHISGYNITLLLSLFDKYAPIIANISKHKSKSYPWFTATLRAFRSTVRHAENLWKNTHSALDRFSFKSHRKLYSKLICTSTKQYFTNLVSYVKMRFGTLRPTWSVHYDVYVYMGKCRK